MKVGIITGASSGLSAELRAARDFMTAGLTSCGSLRAARTVCMRWRRSSQAAACAASRSTWRTPRALRRTGSCSRRNVRTCACSWTARGLASSATLKKIPVRDDIAMCDVNIRALTVLTALTIPYLSKGSGMILISSIASFAPTPRMTVYASTKAYISSLAKGLRAELAPRGINVLVVNPCPMDTEFLEIGKIAGNSRAFARLPRCKPAQVAEISLHKSAKGRGQYTPLLLFKCYRVLAKLLPHSFIMHFSRSSTSVDSPIRHFDKKEGSHAERPAGRFKALDRGRTVGI